MRIGNSQKPELSYFSRVDGLRLMELVSSGLNHHLELGSVTIIFFNKCWSQVTLGTLRKEKMSYVLVFPVYQVLLKVIYFCLGAICPSNPGLKMKTLYLLGVFAPNRASFADT